MSANLDECNRNSLDSFIYKCRNAKYFKFLELNTFQKKFIGNKNITTNIYRLIFIAFCIRFIDFMMNNKRLRDFFNVFFPVNFEKNDEHLNNFLNNLIIE